MNADADDAELADAPSVTSSIELAVCGWCRYMKASISTSPAALGGVERLLDLVRPAG